MKTKFSFRLWRWTGPTENLFDLAPDELATFTAICKEAA